MLRVFPIHCPPEWEEERRLLLEAAHRMLAHVRAMPLDSSDPIPGMLGTLAHLAYHVGAVNQSERANR